MIGRTVNGFLHSFLSSICRALWCSHHAQYPYLTKHDGAAGLIVEAWLADLLEKQRMTRLTVRLPQTLHEQLTTLAEREGVSLNHYIVYALTRQVTAAYTIDAVPERVVAEQRAAYVALRQRLGRASPEEIATALAEREKTEPEEGLNSDIIACVRERLAGRE